MKRVPEPEELMDDPEQARAYAEEDFAEARELFLAQFARLVPGSFSGRALDLGCGSGRAAVWLAERGYRVTGVDHQPEALAMGRELARRRGVACRFMPGDLRRSEAVPA